MGTPFHIPANLKTKFESDSVEYEGLFLSGGAFANSQDHTLVQKYMLTVSTEDGRRLSVGKYVLIDGNQYKIASVLRCDSFYELRLGAI